MDEKVTFSLNRIKVFMLIIWLSCMVAGYLSYLFANDLSEFLGCFLFGTAICVISMYEFMKLYETKRTKFNEKS